MEELRKQGYTIEKAKGRDSPKPSGSRSRELALKKTEKVSLVSL